MKIQLYLLIFALVFVIVLNSGAQEPLAHLSIRWEPGGWGDRVWNIRMTAGDQVTMYAAGYDENWRYIGDQVVVWSTTGTLDDPLDYVGFSLTYSPTTAPTTGKIVATLDNISYTTNNFTVNPGDSCYTNVLGDYCQPGSLLNPAEEGCLPVFEDTATVYVGDLMEFWAASFDCFGNYRQNEWIYLDSTHFEFTGTLKGYIPSGVRSYISVTFTDTGQGRIIFNNQSDTSGVIIVLPDPLDIEDNRQLKREFKLGNAYPNPFNPTTIINYELPITINIDLSIYNLLGQKVATLVNAYQQAGSHQVQWDASGFPSGVYYYKLQSGFFLDVGKMILLR
jgi:hypothetical protein